MDTTYAVTSRFRSPRGRIMLLSLLGGALVSAGTLLPWFTLFAGLQRYPGVIGPYGKALLLAGLLVAGGGIAYRLRGGRALRGALLGAGIGLLAFTSWLLVGLLSVHRDLSESPLMVARLGPGLFLCIVGAVVLCGTAAVREQAGAES